MKNIILSFLLLVASFVFCSCNSHPGEKVKFEPYELEDYGIFLTDSFPSNGGMIFFAKTSFALLKSVNKQNAPTKFISFTIKDDVMSFKLDLETAKVYRAEVDLREDGDAYYLYITSIGEEAEYMVYGRYLADVKPSTRLD